MSFFMKTGIKLKEKVLLKNTTIIADYSNHLKLTSLKSNLMNKNKIVLNYISLFKYSINNILSKTTINKNKDSNDCLGVNIVKNKGFSKTIKSDKKTFPYSILNKSFSVKINNNIPDKAAKKNLQTKYIEIPSVTIVRTKEHAKYCIDILLKNKNRFHAWDTEVLNINPKEESPVGNGVIICLSCFIGPDIDFGNGPRLFIDNYGESENLVDEFKDYFEDPNYYKVWHNYGFDRHILYNHGINVKGFGGDTMHMARMYDTSGLPGSFSLEKLSHAYHNDILKLRESYLDLIKSKLLVNLNGKEKEEKLKLLEVYENFNEGKVKKRDMKVIFASKKILKNGDEGKTMVMPELFELHTDVKYFKDWVTYSVLDTEVVFYLRDVFQKYLQALPTTSLSHVNPISNSVKNNYEFYLKYWREFGELLTDMEREGIKIDIAYLQKIQLDAETDLKIHENKFLDWVYSIDNNLLGFNPGSTQQIQQLFFGPCYKKLTGANKAKFSNKKKIPKNEIPKEYLEDEDDLKAENEEEKELNEEEREMMDEENLEFDINNEYDIGDDLKSMDSSKNENNFKKIESSSSGNKLNGLNNKIEKNNSGFISSNSKNFSVKNESKKRKKPNEKQIYVEILPEVRSFKIDNIHLLQNSKGKILKKRELLIKGFGLKPLSFTDGGVPQVDQHTMKAMLKKEENGKTYAYNQIFKRTNDEKFSDSFVSAISSFEKYKSIETLLKTFIFPLQNCSDSKGRIHCSLNLNTDTGRLSARRPNLQNQPALDKDIYKIRAAFRAEKGNKLIVADYGQLELRILANITKCRSMIEAFKLGGDFHSRTALSMFSEIQEAIDKKECLLEWESSKGAPPAPLLKDKFSALRKKAKTMNFSIAYGKSAVGFSKDWNCSIQEAEESLRKWYNSRKEVEDWQILVKKIAVERAYSQTYLGRYRNLRNKLNLKTTYMHALRASINTPIQGGAADIVVAAMVKVHKNKKLRELGFKIILQIHDEIIMEGPEENAKEALRLLKEDMENPIDFEFPVKMEVDAKIGNTWYEAK